MAGKCGWAWEHKYNKKTEPGKLGAYMFKGTILHRAREKWVLDHSLDLVALVKQAWLELSVGTPRHGVLNQYQALSAKRRNLLEEIMLARPELKMPERSKDYKDHPISKQVYGFEKRMAPVLARDEYDWEAHSITEIYDSTIQVAEAYQEKYQDSPEAMITEIKYKTEVPFVNRETGEPIHLQLGGIIDDVRVLVGDDGPIGYAVVDAKTYGRQPDPLKDWLQMVSYYIAATEFMPDWCEKAEVHYNPELPIYVGIDLMMLLEFQWYSVSGQALDTALEVFANYDAWREVGIFLPNLKSVGGECGFCEFRSECEIRLGVKPVQLAVA